MQPQNIALRIISFACLHTHCGKLYSIALVLMALQRERIDKETQKVSITTGLSRGFGEVIWKQGDFFPILQWECAFKFHLTIIKV